MLVGFDDLLPLGDQLILFQESLPLVYFITQHNFAVSYVSVTVLFLSFRR
jgi:hypothetical protein